MMAEPKRIGVVGSVNRDTVVHGDGRTEGGLGGALYTALALVHLSDFKVRLIARVGRDIEADLRRIGAQWPRLELDGVQVVESGNPHSHITYGADGSKVEVLGGDPVAMQIGRAQIGDLAAGLDGLLVNFITGFDLAKEALQWVRQQGPRAILLDVHSLTLGRRPDGQRFLRRPADWAGWVSAADIVQMNETEAELLAGGKVDDFAPFARQLLGLGPRVAVITRDRRGSLAFERGPEGIVQHQVSAYSPITPVDPTGCGDVFLAGMAAGSFRGLPLAQILQLANRAAGLKAGLQGLAALSQLDQLQGWP